ncbi:hypothetical protein [Nonomuraea sp. NPDC049695]|uniref:hypothetical protein n=1 Tax=Nonomuraea sp. NPDC049695 TaxID=3154734 RepID=UPI00342C7A40
MAASRAALTRDDLRLKVAVQRGRLGGAHRAVQFRPSRWKRLRERVNAGNAPRELRTASTPARDLPADHGPNPSVRSDPKHSNLLHQAVYAETLFLTGGTTAFREAAQEIFAVTKDGPPHAATRHYVPSRPSRNGRHHAPPGPGRGSWS